MIPTILERIENMLGYKAIKTIKIKQGYIEIKENTNLNYQNKISKKEHEKLTSIIDNIYNEKLKKNIKSFATSFFINFK